MFHSKTVIVTGANSGIGFETAKELCMLGHDVAITVRDEAKGNSTVCSILAELPTAKIQFFVMDLCDPSSIRSFVEEFKSTKKRLDILINNAGVFPSFDGTERMIARNNPELELSMTVNCMGTFLLTNLLLDKLKETGTLECPARIVNVSSRLTRWIKREWKFDITDIMLTKPNSYTSGVKAYRGSKIALNLWAYELSKQLKGTNVIINSVCPGIIPSTNLNRHNETISMRIIYRMFDSFVGRILFNTKTASEGKQRVVALALEEKYKNTNGAFFEDGVLKNEAPEVSCPENQKRIWDLCQKYSGLQIQNM